jgi:AcrR family transcriptional regulator
MLGKDLGLVTASSRASRRSSDEVHTLLLAAAHELFSERGYRVTAKEIAARAGVGESLIFTRFGSKAELFQATLADTFLAFVDDYVARWEREPGGGDVADLVRRYVEGLYQVAYDNRRLLRALMAAPDSDPALTQVAAQTSRHLANALGRIHRVLIVSGSAQGMTLDPPATVAATAGMVIAAAVHRDWLLPDTDQDIAPHRLTEEMVTMLLHGLTHRAN